MNRQRRAGFTIVELLIIIAVIVVLAAIAVVAYNGVQGRARLQVARTEMLSIGKSVAIFREEKGRAPVSAADFSDVFKEAGVYNSTRTGAKNFAVCASAHGYAIVAWNPIIGGIKRGETLYLYHDGNGQAIHTLTNSSLESNQQIDKVCDQVYPPSTLEMWSENLP